MCVSYIFCKSRASSDVGFFSSSSIRFYDIDLRRIRGESIERRASCVCLANGHVTAIIAILYTIILYYIVIVTRTCIPLLFVPCAVCCLRL